jgi:hypothetical protein
MPALYSTIQGRNLHRLAAIGMALWAVARSE